MCSSLTQGGIIAAFLAATAVAPAFAETPRPDTTTQADKAAIESRRITNADCQDWNNPCLIRVNTPYSVHGSPNMNKFYSFRFIIPDGVTEVRFDYKSEGHKPTIDVAYWDDRTEYFPEMQKFTSKLISFPFKVGSSDPDGPGSHNRFGRVIPTDYQIIIRGFPRADSVDFTFSIDF